jgi:hypothetical protein
MNLYCLKTKSINHNYYVVAEHPTQAQEYLKNMLDLANYDFSSNRETIEISLIAKQVVGWKGKPCISDVNNLLIVENEKEKMETWIRCGYEEAIDVVLNKLHLNIGAEDKMKIVNTLKNK